METRVVEQFVAVADEGSMSQAAARLFVAQSTVSAAVKSLERELGTTLFTRQGRRVVLTVSGTEVLAHARTMLGAADQMRDTATVTDAALRGRVRFGIFTSMEVVDLTRVFRRFRDRHPLVDIALVSSASGTTGLTQEVHSGRLDLAYCGLPHPQNDITVYPLRDIPFRVFLAPDHPLATRRSLSLAALADEPFIDTSHGFGNRIILDRAIAAIGLQRRIVAELNEMPAVVRFAASGLGVAVVPDAGSHYGAAVLELEDDIPPLHIGLAVRTEPEPNRATAALAREIVAAATDVGR